MKILTLDGGGVRGFLTACILEDIEKILNTKDKSEKSLDEYFDLIAGTSTDAIIAGLLAIGKRADDIKALYQKDIPEIFSKKAKRFFFTPGTKYKKDILKQKAKEYFGELTFEDVKTHLLVTAVDIVRMEPRLYKSKYNDSNISRSDEKLYGAILASVSAPTYFEVEMDLKHSTNLIDGGIVANNPSMIALSDVFSFCNNDIGTSGITLLSVGTGKFSMLPYNPNSLKNTIIKWLLPNAPLVEILLNTQSELAEFQTKTFMKQLGYENGYKRINPQLKMKMGLDDAKDINNLLNFSSLDGSDTNWIIKKLL